MEDRRGVPFAVDAGPCTMHNLCYVQALQAAARMASPMGRPALAADYTSRAQAILAGVQSQCYDAARGLFREGPAVDEYTQHAQILAILPGLVSGGEARALMERTMADSSLIPCSFPWMSISSGHWRPSAYTSALTASLVRVSRYAQGSPDHGAGTSFLGAQRLSCLERPCAL